MASYTGNGDFAVRFVAWFRLWANTHDLVDGNRDLAEGGDNRTQHQYSVAYTKDGQWTHSGQLERFIPKQTVHAQLRCEVELDKCALALIVDKSPGVNTKTLHHSIRSRNGPVGKNPHAHRGGLRAQTHPVPRIVVSRLSLRNLVVRLGFERVYQIGELNRILNEENGDICRSKAAD